MAWAGQRQKGGLESISAFGEFLRGRRIILLLHPNGMKIIQPGVANLPQVNE